MGYSYDETSFYLQFYHFYQTI